jgi:hypothetical protein
MVARASIFFVTGAWFDNHYTMRRGWIFYNGIPCVARGNVWPKSKVQLSRNPSDPRCHPDLSLEDREKYCE